MKKEAIIDSIGRVQDDLILELDQARQTVGKKSVLKRYWRSFATIAATAAAAATIVGAGPQILSDSYATDPNVGSAFGGNSIFAIIGGCIILIGCIVAFVFYKKDK